jgi:branched-chain amino acid transport system permease protein
MSTFLQLTFAGLNVGALYMLSALGMVVTYQVSRVESLAQGVFVVFGSLVFATAHDSLGLPLPAAVGASLAAGAVIATVLHTLALNKWATRGATGPVVMTLGAAILGSELARDLWGLDNRSAAPFLSGTPLHLFGATVLPHSLLMWAGSAVMVAGGFVIFERTMIGKALRAASDDVQGARLVGVNARRMQFISFQVAGLFGATAGILLAALMPFGWSSVFPLAVVGALGAVAGRWEYLSVAISSVAIGLFASYAGGYVSTTWQDLYVYGAFIAVLLLLREDRRAGSRRRLRLTTLTAPATRRGSAQQHKRSEPPSMSTPNELK